jgi:RNA polymerase sigma-70 factor (ECF subfamily)
MFRVARRLTGCSGEAEDLVQETYVQAWRKIDTLRDVDRMRSWMFAILRNQYLKSIRKKKPVATEDVQNIEDIGSSTEKGNRGPADIVQQALLQLEEDQRLPILLVSMEGMSAEEASEVLGIPRGTVLSRMHRGRNRLKEIIEAMAME